MRGNIRHGKDRALDRHGHTGFTVSLIYSMKSLTGNVRDDKVSWTSRQRVKVLQYKLDMKSVTGNARHLVRIVEQTDNT